MLDCSFSSIFLSVLLGLFIRCSVAAIYVILATFNCLSNTPAILKLPIPYSELPLPNLHMYNVNSSVMINVSPVLGLKRFALRNMQEANTVSINWHFNDDPHS